MQVEAVMVFINNVVHTGARLPDGRLLYTAEATLGAFSGERTLRLLHPGAEVQRLPDADRALNGAKPKPGAILLEAVGLRFGGSAYAGARLPTGRLLYALRGTLRSWSSEAALRLVYPDARAVPYPAGDAVLNVAAPLHIVGGGWG